MRRSRRRAWLRWEIRVGVGVGLVRCTRDQQWRLIFGCSCLWNVPCDESSSRRWRKSVTGRDGVLSWQMARSKRANRALQDKKQNKPMTRTYFEPILTRTGSFLVKSSELHLRGMHKTVVRSWTEWRSGGEKILGRFFESEVYIIFGIYYIILYVYSIILYSVYYTLASSHSQATPSRPTPTVC